MNGIYFIFLALVTSIASSLLVKTVLKPESSPDSVAYGVITFLLGGIYAAVFYVLTAFNMHDFQTLARPEILLFVALDIVLWAVSFRIAFPAYKHLPVSETTIFASLDGVFALLFGVLLFHTDAFYASRIIGSMLILSSVVIVSQHKGKWHLNKYSLALIIATVLIGLAIVTDNLIVARGFFSSTAFFIALNFGIPPLVVLALRPRTARLLPTIYKDRKATVAVVITSFTSVLTFFLVYQAYRMHVVASQSYLILSSQTVAVVLLGALIFKEQTNLPKKILAGLIATIGVYLIA